jgi:hypothetical protein
MTGQQTTGSYLYRSITTHWTANSKNIGHISANNGAAAFVEGELVDIKSGTIEPESTNLLTYSNDYSHDNWTKQKCSYAADAETAPDGTVSADTLIEDSVGNGSHEFRQTYFVTSGNTYTFSAEVKTNGRDVELILRNTGFSDTSKVLLDFSTGIVSDVTGTPESYGVEPLVNDWYRLYITDTATASTASLFYIRTHNGSTDSYTGDGVSGIHVGISQLEDGIVATSTILTANTAVTRPARYLPGSGATTVGTGEVCAANLTTVTIKSVEGSTSANSTADIKLIVGETSLANITANDVLTVYENFGDEEGAYWAPVYFYDEEQVTNEGRKHMILPDLALSDIIVDSFNERVNRDTDFETRLPI